jgi:hypothetical protein
MEFFSYQFIYNIIKAYHDENQTDIEHINLDKETKEYEEKLRMYKEEKGFKDMLERTIGSQVKKEIEKGMIEG